MADTTKYLMYQKNNIHEIEILDANEEDFPWTKLGAIKSTPLSMVSTLTCYNL